MVVLIVRGFIVVADQCRKAKKKKDSRRDVGASLPEVPPMSMALRLRALMMLTVMVLAVGL